MSSVRSLRPLEAATARIHDIDSVTASHEYPQLQQHPATSTGTRRHTQTHRAQQELIQSRHTRRTRWRRRHSSPNTRTQSIRSIRAAGSFGHQIQHSRSFHQSHSAIRSLAGTTACRHSALSQSFSPFTSQSFSRPPPRVIRSCIKAARASAACRARREPRSRIVPVWFSLWFRVGFP